MSWKPSEKVYQEGVSDQLCQMLLIGKQREDWAAGLADIVQSEQLRAVSMEAKI